MTADVARDRVVDAFDAAVDYWHAQLDEPITEHRESDRPDTAREYFEEVRGFDSKTVDEWRLGWAPPNGGLYDHLDGEGFNADTIAATGLFCNEDPDRQEGRSQKELWRGRYVLPYFSADGRAEYAIGRCTGSKGGGKAGYDGHSRDFLAGKYAKVAHASRDNVPLSEPILGLHTLDTADEVVVAEGIADAISATEAGYAVLSPVTKEFKQEHFEAVVEAVEEHAVGRVYVVPDAEQVSFSEIDSDDVPDEPEHIYEAITQPAVAPGPGGGLRTANYLVEHGIDARLVELPRPSGGKVDLDDYIQEWQQPLGPVLRSAKPPADHQKFEAATASQDTDPSGDTSATAEGDTADTSSTSSDRTSASGLFDLDVGDVNADLEAGYRGKNPLGHTGNSETYFVVRQHPKSGDLIATDYKRPSSPRYTGVTYLLVEIGERPVEGPMGELSPKETWEAWSEARRRGLLGEDDVIPEKALEYIADDRDLYDLDALPEDSDELPPKAHNRALWWLNNRWAEEHLNDDENSDDWEKATDRRAKRKTSVVQTWEDVRYIYQDDKNAARHAAEAVLQDEHEFMTIDEYDQLHVYDDATGTYAPELAEVKGEIKDGLGKHWSTHELNEILARLRQSPRVSVDDLNGKSFDNPHICVQNGVLDILSEDLKEHTPDYYFTNRLPVVYDAEADTSAYDEFLDELTARPEDKKALLEMVGHAITPDAYSRKWKKFLILTGDTNNGKSVFFSRVQSLLNGPDGQEGNTANVKLAKIARNQFSNNSVYGKWANIAGEIDGKKIRNTGSIKDITGGDSVEIEPKGEDSFFDTLDATFMFAANDPPIIGERDKDAIASRIVPIELPNTFVDNPDGDYQKKKKSESELCDWLDTEEALSGFLRLAVEGANRLDDNNGDVSLPESNKERLRMYERKADPMREFGERCLKNSDGDYLVKADVTTIYKEFASSLGHEVGQNTNKTLHNVLRGLSDLNYTDSRPRSPDYTDTSLDLRGWDERKFVINRVTLTEEGLKHAETAGLIEDDTDDAEAPEYYTPSSVDLSEFDDRDKLETPLVATPTMAWEGEYKNPTAELVGEDGNTVDIRFQGPFGVEHLPYTPGKEHEFTELRVRNKQGERPWVEYFPSSTAKLLESPTVDNTGDGEEAKATDGGESDGATEEDEDTRKGTAASGVVGGDMKPLIRMYFDQQPGDVNHADLVEHLREKGAVDEQIDHWIDKLRSRKGLILEPEEEGVYRWGGR